MDRENPYYSFVIVARNDDYGGDFNLRLQNMLRWLAYLVEAIEIPSELVIVNYNPLRDKASLAKSLDYGKSRKYLTIRIIDVPSEIHEKYLDPAVRRTVPLFEYIGKNIGIRRAKGEYICCMNPDVLFDFSIIPFFKKKRAEKGKYYRVNRFDFYNDSKKEINPNLKSISWIWSQTFKVFVKGNTFSFPRGKINRFKFHVLKFQNWVQIQKNNFLLKIRDTANKYSWPMNYDNVPHRYHVNCSGDFLLMHRDHWWELRGHPESTFLAIHTDAIFVVMASVSGIKEITLPAPIFHQDHSRRYKSDGDSEDPEIRKMFKWFIRESEEMEEKGKVKLYNDSFWGCSKEDFEEEYV